MTPAIEYLIRTGLIREWLEIPCSLFLQGAKDSKKVVTISEEFRPSDFYSVKHWNISQCDPRQPVPSMEEFRVRKDDLFGNPATLVPFHKLIPFRCLTIPSDLNEPKSPMTDSIYDFFYSNSVYPNTESAVWREDWLWSSFRQIYLTNFLDVLGYISSYSPAWVQATHERKWVCNHSKRLWRIWNLWQEYMLHSPGELFFYKEYRG